MFPITICMDDTWYSAHALSDVRERGTCIFQMVSRRVLNNLDKGHERQLRI